MRLDRLILVLGCFSSLSLEAQPKRYMNRSSIDEVHCLIDDMRYATSNHETELRMFEEKLKNQELALDSLWKQFNDSTPLAKEQIKDSLKPFEGKISDIESKTSLALVDLKHLKSHANEGGEALSQAKKKIASLENELSVLNKNLDHLHAAVKSIMEALHLKDSNFEMESVKESGLVASSTYKVKAGDSLEKIAKKHSTTVSKLRDINHLSDGKDLIVVGQSLKIPAS
jgi:LysM repeat protein